jgi:hypothetical protein
MPSAHGESGCRRPLASWAIGVGVLDHHLAPSRAMLETR